MVQIILNEEPVDAGHHLGIASLHVSECNFWVDRVAAGHTENLQVGVFFSFVYLQMHTEWNGAQLLIKAASAPRLNETC